MELRWRRKEEASHASPRTASQDDPQECAALRQGNIALIHSAPTGERYLMVRGERGAENQSYLGWSGAKSGNEGSAGPGFRGACHRAALRADPWFIRATYSLGLNAR